QQVATNLLTNAIRYTPPGGSIHVRVTTAEGGVRLSIQDTGQGIAPQLLSHIFDHFRQGDSRPSRRHGGLGLGLAIARHLVELHDGRVTATSGGVDQGATFSVWLPTLDRANTAPTANPAALLVDAPSRATAAAALVSDVAVRLQGVRVLLVDGDRDAAELMGTVLR